jgi:hypothetical protein
MRTDFSRKSSTDPVADPPLTRFVDGPPGDAMDDAANEARLRGLISAIYAEIPDDPSHAWLADEPVARDVADDGVAAIFEDVLPTPDLIEAGTVDDHAAPAPEVRRRPTPLPAYRRIAERVKRQGRALLPH